VLENHNEKPIVKLMLKNLELQINGTTHKLKANPERRLLSVLRDDLNLTGTKYGCGEAQCGTCTVLINGIATRSCVTPVENLGGKQITTIEGLENNGKLHPLQEAFLKADAMQCAFCTSGMIMSGVALLKRKARPTRDEIIEHMNGNVCRCGAYERIISAIQIASGQRNGNEK
jgi:aerobic-type carbon monoxide dehydrogenase small subunit (CoxS/CutS family)